MAHGMGEFNIVLETFHGLGKGSVGGTSIALYINKHRHDVCGGRSGGG